MDYCNKKAVRDYGSLLMFASVELRGDKEVVIEAVKNNGRSLVHASVELRGDKEVVIEAVKKSGYSLEYASEELRNDEFFMAEIFAERPNDFSVYREYFSLRIKGELQKDEHYLESYTPSMTKPATK